MCCLSEIGNNTYKIIYLMSGINNLTNYHGSHVYLSQIRQLVHSIGGGGGGGLKRGRGGEQVKFYPYKKKGGGGQKVLAMLKGGGGAQKKIG